MGAFSFMLKFGSKPALRSALPAIRLPGGATAEAPAAVIAFVIHPSLHISLREL
jgi:hypothetical protein